MDLKLRVMKVERRGLFPVLRHNNRLNKITTKLTLAGIASMISRPAHRMLAAALLAVLAVIHSHGARWVMRAGSSGELWNMFVIAVKGFVNRLLTSLLQMYRAHIINR